MSIVARHRRARPFLVPAAPVAAFSADAPTGPFPRTVTFTDESTNNPSGYSWDFGNGQTAATKGPHAIVYDGVSAPYTASLTVTGGGGSDPEVKAGYVIGPSLWLGDVTGANYWKDAAKTLAAANGDLVYTVADRSGNAKDGVQATSGNRATLALVSGRYYLRFASAHPDSYPFAAVNLTGDFGVFVVHKTTGDVAFFGDDSAGGFPQFRIGANPPGENRLSTYDPDGNNPSSNVLTQARSVINFIAFTRSGTTVTFWENGVSKGTGTMAGTIPISRMGGLLPGGTAVPIEGDIGEVMIFPAALSAGNVAALTARSQALWGTP